MLNNPQIYNFYTLVFFLFGSLLGSFSNVVILRMSTNTSVIFPPSACPNCKHKLTPLDLVPVFSWLFLRGQCRYCKNPISRQYPLVEFFIACILGFSFYKHGLSPQFIGTASALTIWFIASVIFLRNEVQGFRPFFWALLYCIPLMLLAHGYDATPHSQRILIIFLASIYVASFMSNKKELHKLIPISFIGLLWLSRLYPLFYVGLALTLLAGMAKNGPLKILFFAGQVIAISLIIIP